MLKNLVSILCLLQLVSSFKEKEEPLNVLIGKLADKINSFQVLKPLNASPPFHWYEKKGLFRSDIRLNFAGNNKFIISTNYLLNLKNLRKIRIN